MHPFTILLLLLAASGVGCSPIQPADSAQDKYQITEISLERSGSWGMRSGYKVVLRKDGTAEYTGDVAAARRGKYHGKISGKQFEQLAKIIVGNDYFSLEDKYRATVTDTDTVITSVAYKGGRKVVEDFGRGGGERLTTTEQAIDAAAEQITWVIGG